MSTMSSTARPVTAGLFFRWIGACAHALAVHFERRAAIKALHELDDRALRDIGLSRCEVEKVFRGFAKPDITRIW